MKESKSKMRTATQAPQSASGELRYQKRIDVIKVKRQPRDVPTRFHLPKNRIRAVSAQGGWHLVDVMSWRYDAMTMGKPQHSAFCLGTFKIRNLLSSAVYLAR